MRCWGGGNGGGREGNVEIKVTGIGSQAVKLNRCKPVGYCINSSLAAKNL